MSGVVIYFCQTILIQGGKNPHKQKYRVPVNKELFTETVSVSKELLTGMDPANNFILLLLAIIHFFFYLFQL